VFHVVKNSLITFVVRSRSASLRTSASLGLVLATLSLAEACSLTVGDFEPQQVTRESRPDEPADNSETGSACAIGERCCVVSLDCADGEACIAGMCEAAACVDDASSGASCEPCVGADCSPMPVQLAPTCSDNVQNGDEAGVDCGSTCPERCANDATCTVPNDCVSFNCVDGACADAACDDSTLNQDETGVDCGGSCPRGCEADEGCSTSADCAGTLFCSTEGLCTDPSCQDEQRNGDETAVDCGGACSGCANGVACNVGSDCLSGVCGADSTCAQPSCNDEAQNQNETGVDCGGFCAAGCGNGSACVVASDCQSNVCGTANCGPGVARCCQAPSCTDDILNGNESDTDCGGNCPNCPDLSDCRVNADCISNNCSGGECSSCTDTEANGTETDVDCGGNNACARCGPGLECVSDADCASNACQDGRCCGGNQGDCTRCGERLSPNLNCALGPPGAEPACTQFLQCLRANPAACPTRFTPGCSGEGNVCNHNNFGGDGGIALTFVTQILDEAACTQ
jgi:hypothetical protein